MVVPLVGKMAHLGLISNSPAANRAVAGPAQQVTLGSIVQTPHVASRWTSISDVTNAFVSHRTSTAMFG